MVTFLIVSGQYQSGAKAVSRSRPTVVEPEKLLDAALYVNLRDTLNAKSPLRGHSLLLDMYGMDGFKGTVSAAGPAGAGAGVVSACAQRTFPGLTSR